MPAPLRGEGLDFPLGVLIGVLYDSFRWKCHPLQYKFVLEGVTFPSETVIAHQMVTRQIRNQGLADFPLPTEFTVHLPLING